MSVSDSRNQIRFLLDIESIFLMNCKHSIKYPSIVTLSNFVLNCVYLTILDIVNMSVM